MDFGATSYIYERLFNTALSFPEKLRRASYVFGVVGAVSATLQLGGYTYALLISGPSAEPYYNPFDAQASFLLAGLAVAGVLGFTGGMVVPKNGKLGGTILFTAMGVGFVSPIPYYVSVYRGFLFIPLLLYYPPWWTILFLVAGLFALWSMKPPQPDNPTNSGKDP